MAIKDKLFAAAKAVGVRREAVEIFGETLYVHALTAKEKDLWEKSITVVHKGKARVADNVRASLVARTTHDESGNRVFSKDDIETIGEMPAAEVSALFDVAQKLNKVSDEDVEELAGN